MKKMFQQVEMVLLQRHGGKKPYFIKFIQEASTIRMEMELATFEELLKN